jgi:hypothetical protein
MFYGGCIWRPGHVLIVFFSMSWKRDIIQLLLKAKINVSLVSVRVCIHAPTQFTLAHKHREFALNLNIMKYSYPDVTNGSTIDLLRGDKVSTREREWAIEHTYATVLGTGISNLNNIRHMHHNIRFNGLLNRRPLIAGDLQHAA